jgi:hypothetical protein
MLSCVSLSLSSGDISRLIDTSLSLEEIAVHRKWGNELTAKPRSDLYSKDVLGVTSEVVLIAKSSRQIRASRINKGATPKWTYNSIGSKSEQQFHSRTNPS